MDSNFRFDPDGSDEEAAAEASARRKLPTQSPWEFSSYAESVAAEHARRRTTSIDDKISQALRGRRNPSIPDEPEGDESGSGDEDGDDSDDEEVEGESGDEEDELEESEDEEGIEESDDEEVEEEECKGEEEGGEEEGCEQGEEEAAQEEQDTAEQGGTVDPSKFFGSSKGASFHANSFLELNLSRPLLRACEALGYQKPTPIQAKKAGSQLKSRIVAEKPVAECAKLIEQLEDQIYTVIQEEREERASRKAEMEATKAENMIAHKDDIYSCPKRTWFATETEKKLLAKAAKESVDQVKSSSGVVSAQQAEDLRLKEKRRRLEESKNLPRKKRRRLEAQQEMLEDENEDEEEAQESKGGKKAKIGKSLVDMAYRRAKSMKATGKKGAGAGKGKNEKKARQHSEKAQTRQQEMHELFQNDMSEWKQGRSLKKNNSSFARQKSKNSFKSNSRYKRRK